jgi:aspartyl protease family protein
MIGWAVKQLLLWSTCAVVAALIATDRAELAALLDRARDSASDSEAADENGRGGRSLTLHAGHGGHFWVDAEVEGTTVRFVIDTGATGVVLSGDDAERVGLRIDRRDYTELSHTAGGMVRSAPVVLREVGIGPLSVRNVQASVNPRLEGISLLGMSFLSRLDGYEVQRDRMKLYW